MLKEDDTLAAEATSEEDEDGTRLESLAVGGGTDCFAGLQMIRLAGPS